MYILGWPKPPRQVFLIKCITGAGSHDRVKTQATCCAHSGLHGVVGNDSGDDQLLNGACAQPPLQAGVGECIGYVFSTTCSRASGASASWNSQPVCPGENTEPAVLEICRIWTTGRCACLQESSKRCMFSSASGLFLRPSFGSDIPFCISMMINAALALIEGMTVPQAGNRRVMLSGLWWLAPARYRSLSWVRVCGSPRVIIHFKSALTGTRWVRSTHCTPSRL